MELPAAEDFVARVHDRALLETIEGYVSGLDPGEQAVFRLPDLRGKDLPGDRCRHGRAGSGSEIQILPPDRAAAKGV